MSAWGKNSSARSCDALLKRVEDNDPTLKELVILPLKTFASKDLQRLAEALPNNTHLVSVQASGHVIEDVSALERLGGALMAPPQKSSLSALAELSVGDSSMGDEGVAALCRGMQNASSKLEEDEPSQCKLKSIDLSWKGIGHKGLDDVVRVFGNGTTSPCLQTINLSRNEAIGSEFDFIAVAPSLPLFPHVKNLDISDCHLNAKSCASLLKALASGNSGDNTSTNRQLTIKLSGNDLSDSAHFQQMMETIVDSSHISELYMANCNIGDAGMNWFAVIESASANQSHPLKVLDLSNNDLTDSGLQALTSSTHFAQLQSLHLAGNAFGDDSNNDMESACTQLAAAIQNGGSLMSLRELNVSQTSCGVDGARALLRCRRSSLTALNLFGNRLGSDGFVALSHELEGGHPQLETLDVGGNEADEAGVVALLQALTRPGAEGEANRLRLLVVGGNQGGPAVETVVTEIKRLHPELDVARDKPRRNDNQQMSQTTWMA